MGDENGDDDVEKRVTSSNPTNRVDLIARTIYMMERIHEGNIKRRKKMSKLQQDIMDVEKRAKVAEDKLQKQKLDGKQQVSNCFLCIYSKRVLHINICLLSK